MKAKEYISSQDEIIKREYSYTNWIKTILNSNLNRLWNLNALHRSRLPQPTILPSLPAHFPNCSYPTPTTSPTLTQHEHRAHKDI